MILVLLAVGLAALVAACCACLSDSGLGEVCANWIDRR